MTANNQLEFKGEIRIHPVAELIAEFLQNRLSGSVRLSKKEQKAIVYFDAGDVVFAVSNERRFRLFEIILTQELLEKKDLAGIDGLANDLHLIKVLVEKESITKESADSMMSFQMAEIIKDLLGWKIGDFDFSPSARIKSGIRFDVDIQGLLTEYVANMADHDIIERVTKDSERFQMREGVDILAADLTPQEGFIVSRVTTESHTVEALESMTGLDQYSLKSSLYKLWISGFVDRFDWMSALSQEDTDNLVKAKFEMIKGAKDFEKEQEEKEKAEQELLAKEKEAKDKLLKLTQDRHNISLDDYLDSVDNAATHYEIFDISPDSKVSAIKSAYFALAKRFHPDLFFKQVDNQTHQRIQNAFTEIAQAYDTLKDGESREVYDFKLRKAIEQIRVAEAGVDAELTKEDLEMTGQAKMASENFDIGYDHLLKDNVQKALPYLGRAVHMDDGNARYHAFYGQALSYDSDSYRKAEHELQKALKLESDNANYRMMLAELLIGIGQPKRAKGELTRLLNQHNGHKEARRLLDSLEA